MANVFDIFNVKPSQEDVKIITTEVETVPLKDSNVTCQKNDKQTVVLEPNCFENKHGGKLPGNDTSEDDQKLIKIDNAPSFVIPKLKRKGEDVLTEIGIDSHEFQQELLPAVTKSFKCSTSHKRFTFHRARTIHNSDISQSYLEKRRELKQAGYSDRDVADSYAFLYVDLETEVERICKEGVKIGNQATSCLGDPHMGVQLSKHADVLRANSYPIRFNGQLLIFKIIKGHVKAVFENRNPPYLEPTPNHDCHVSKSSTADINAGNPLQLFESSQIYLYEYGDLTVEDFPRHICPFAVLSFVYKTEVRPPKQLEIPSLSPKLSSPVNSYTPGSKSMVSPGFKPLMSPSSKSTISPGGKSLVSPGGKSLVSPGGKNMLSPGNREYSSVDEEYTTWSGRLSVKGLFSCQVEMFSTASCIKPVKIGSTLNVTKKCSLPLAQDKYFGQLSSLRKNGEVYWRSNYINVCELRPKSDSQVQFQKVRNYLGKHNSMAVLNPDVDTVLLLMPDCSLTYTLGLTKPHQYRLVLHCIFLSKQSCKFKSPRYAMNQSRYQSQNSCSNMSCSARSPMSPPTHFSTPLHVNVNNNNNQPHPCSPSLFTPPPTFPLVSDPWSNPTTVSPKFFPQFHPSIPPPLPPLPPPPPPPPPTDQSPMCPVGSPMKTGLSQIIKSSSQPQLVTLDGGVSPTASSGNCSPLSPLSRSIVAARGEAGPAARMGPVSDTKLLYPKQSSHQDPKLFHRSISSPEMHDPPRPLRLTSLPHGGNSLHLGFDEGFVHKVPAHCLLNTGNVQELFESQHQSRLAKSKSKNKNKHLLTECEQDSTISSTCAEDEANLDRGRRARSDSVQSNSDMEMTESQLDAIVKNYVPADPKHLALHSDSSCSPLKSPQRVDFVASAEDMRTFLENNLKRSTVVSKPERTFLDKANEKCSPKPVKTVEDSPAVTSTESCKGEDQSHLSTANDMKQFLNSTLSKPIKRPSPRKEMKKGFNPKDKMIKLSDERRLRPILQKIKRYKMKSWFKNFRSPSTVITVLPTFIREIDMKYIKKCPKKTSSSPMNIISTSAETATASKTPPSTFKTTSSSTESPQPSTPSKHTESPQPSTSQHTPTNKDSPVIQSSPGFLALSRRNTDWATQGLSPLTLFSPPRCVSVSGETTQVNIVNTYHEAPSAPQGGKMAAIHYLLHGLSGSGNVSTSLTESVTAVLHMEEEEEDIRYVKKADSDEKCDEESSEECVVNTPDHFREECVNTPETASEELPVIRPESPLEHGHMPQSQGESASNCAALVGDCKGNEESADEDSRDIVDYGEDSPEDAFKKSASGVSSNPHDKRNASETGECDKPNKERHSHTEKKCDNDKDNSQTDTDNQNSQPEQSGVKEQAAAPARYQSIPVVLGRSVDRVSHQKQEFGEAAVVTGSNNIAIEPVQLCRQRRSWIDADILVENNNRSENKSKSSNKSRLRSKSGCSSELRSRSSSSNRSKQESKEVASSSESKSNKSKEKDSKSDHKDRRESKHHRSKSDSHRAITGHSRKSSSDRSKSRTEAGQSTRTGEHKSSKTEEQQSRTDEQRSERESKKDKHARSYSRDSQKEKSRARTSPDMDKRQHKNSLDTMSRDSSRSRHSSKSSTKSDAESGKSLDTQLKAVSKIVDSLYKDRHVGNKSQNKELSEKSCEKKEKGRTEVTAPDKSGKLGKVTNKLSQMSKIADKISKVEKPKQETSTKFGDSKANTKAKEKIKKDSEKIKQGIGFNKTSFPKIPGLYTEEMVAGISRGEFLNTSSIPATTSQLKDCLSESQKPLSGAVRNISSSLITDRSTNDLARDRQRGDQRSVQKEHIDGYTVTESSSGEDTSLTVRSVVSRMSCEKNADGRSADDQRISTLSVNETRPEARSDPRIQRRVEFKSDNHGSRNAERTVEFQGTQSGQPVRNLNIDQISEDRHSRQFHPYRNCRRQKPMANFNIGVQNLDELLADLTASSLKERRLEEHWSFGLHHNFRQRSRFSKYRFIRNPVLPSPVKNRPSRQAEEHYDFTPDNIPEFETRSYQADMLDDFFMGEQSKEPELAAAFDIEKATYSTEAESGESVSGSHALGATTTGSNLLRPDQDDLNVYEDKENIETIPSHHSPLEERLGQPQDVNSDAFFDQIGWSFSSNRIKTREDFTSNNSTFALDASISNDDFHQNHQTLVEENPQREITPTISAISNTQSCPVDPRLIGYRTTDTGPTKTSSCRNESSDFAMFHQQSSLLEPAEEHVLQKFVPTGITEDEETIQYGANGFPEMTGSLPDEALSRESQTDDHDDLREMAMDLDDNILNEQNHDESQNSRSLQESVPVETKRQDQMLQGKEKSSPRDSFRFFSELWSSSTGMELSGQNKPLDKSTSGKINTSNANPTSDSASGPSLNRVELQERKNDAAKMLEELNSYLNVDEDKMSGRRASPTEEAAPTGNKDIVIDKKITSFFGCMDSAVGADSGSPLQHTITSRYPTLSGGPSAGVTGHHAHQGSRQGHKADSLKRQYSSEEHQVPVSDASNSSSDLQSKEVKTKTVKPCKVVSRSNSEESKVRKKRHHRRPTGPHPDQFNHWEHVVFPLELDPWRDFKYERNPQLGSYHVLELHDCPSADPRRNKEILQKRDKEMLNQHSIPSTLSSTTKKPLKKNAVPNSMLERELFAPTLAEQITCASQERRKQLLAGSGTGVRRSSEHREADLKIQSKGIEARKESTQVELQGAGDSYSSYTSRHERSSYPKPMKLDHIPTPAASVDQHVKDMQVKQLSKTSSDINPGAQSKNDDTDKALPSRTDENRSNYDFPICEKGDACSMKGCEAVLESKDSTESDHMQLNKRKHSCSSSDVVQKMARLDNVDKEMLKPQVHPRSLNDCPSSLSGVVGQDAGSLDKHVVDDVPYTETSRMCPAPEMTTVDIVSIKQFDSSKPEAKSSHHVTVERTGSLNEVREDGEITSSEEELQESQLTSTQYHSSITHRQHDVPTRAHQSVESNQQIRDGSAINPIVLTSSEDENQPLERRLRSITDNVTAIQGKVLKELDNVASIYVSRNEIDNDNESSTSNSKRRSPDFKDDKASLAREYKLSAGESRFTKSLDSRLEEFCSQVMPLVENVMNQIHVVEDPTDSGNETSLTKNTALTSDKSLSHESIEEKENMPFAKKEETSLSTRSIDEAETSTGTHVHPVPPLTSQAPIVNACGPPAIYPQACYQYSSLSQHDMTTQLSSTQSVPNSGGGSQADKEQPSGQQAALSNRVYFNPRMMHMWPQIHQSYYPPFPHYPPHAYSQPIHSDAQGLPYPVSSLTNSAGLPWNMNTSLGVNLSPYQYAPQYPFYPMVPPPPPPRLNLPSPTVSPVNVDPPSVTVEQIAFMQQQRVAHVFDESVSQIATIAENISENFPEDQRVSGGDCSELHSNLQKDTSRHEESSNEIMRGVFATCDSLLAEIMEQDSQASSSTSDVPSSTSVTDIIRDAQRASPVNQDMDLDNDDSMVTSSIEIDVDVSNFRKEIREHVDQCVKGLRSSPSSTKTRETKHSLAHGLVELSSTCYDYCDSVSVPERLQESLMQSERRVINQLNQVQRQVYETPPSGYRQGSQGGVVNAEDSFFISGDPDQLATILLCMYDQCRAGMKWQLLVHSSIVVELAKKREQEDSSTETDTHRKLSIISAYRKRGIVRLLSICDCDRYMRSSYSLGICVAKFRQKEFPLLKQSFMLSEDAADYTDIPDGTRKVVYLAPKMFIEKYLMHQQVT